MLEKSINKNEGKKKMWQEYSWGGGQIEWGSTTKRLLHYRTKHKLLTLSSQSSNTTSCKLLSRAKIERWTVNLEGTLNESSKKFRGQSGLICHLNPFGKWKSLCIIMIENRTGNYSWIMKGLKGINKTALESINCCKGYSRDSQAGQYTQFIWFNKCFGYFRRCWIRFANHFSFIGDSSEWQIIYFGYSERWFFSPPLGSWPFRRSGEAVQKLGLSLGGCLLHYCQNKLRELGFISCCATAIMGIDVLSQSQSQRPSSS